MNSQAKLNKILVCGAFLLIGCKCTSKQQQQMAGTKVQRPELVMKAKDMKQLPDLAANQPATDRIAPGTCRIIGKVINILPDLELDKNTPCGQTPCKALVQIQQVLGYGSAFPQTVAAGEKIKVYFKFTLSATPKYFPELAAALPGLAAGSTFQADIQNAGDSAGSVTGWFSVNGYKIP